MQPCQVRSPNFILDIVGVLSRIDLLFDGVEQGGLGTFTYVHMCV